jgi:hypothetical protein
MKRMISTKHTFMGSLADITIVDRVNLWDHPHYDFVKSGTVIDSVGEYHGRFQAIILNGKLGYVDPTIVRFEDAGASKMMNADSFQYWLNEADSLLNAHKQTGQVLPHLIAKALMKAFDNGKSYGETHMPAPEKVVINGQTYVKENV